MDSQLKESNIAEAQPVKKTYSKPQLTVYGSIQTLTQTMGSGMINDGMMNKTS